MDETTDTLRAFYIAATLGAAVLAGFAAALAYGAWTWLRDRWQATRGAPQ